MSLPHAILGFVHIEPATGYTLMQRFQGSVGSFWSATQSQIYRELHGLESRGLVRVEVVPQEGKPARKLYSLTRDGRRELHDWLTGEVEPLQLRDPFLLRLAFSAELPLEVTLAMLQNYEDRMSERLAEYDRRLGAAEIFALARSDRERALWIISIESGIAWCEAQIAWLKLARERLEATRT